MQAENNFPTVQELSNGFSEFKLDQAKELISKELKLFYEDEQITTYTFLDSECLKVKYQGAGEDETYACVYSAVSPRKDIYIIDFIQSYGQTQSVTTVIDLLKEIATTMVAILPTKEEADISQLVRAEKELPMTSVTATFLHASIESEFTKATQKHDYTTDLIGKTVQFRYSTNDVYEHIYLNDKFYTWHCTQGIESGLCDTDRCYYLKIEENLYWFTWLEKVVPTIGTVVEDLEEGTMRSYGKICGYDSYATGKITNFQVGSYASLK